MSREILTGLVGKVMAVLVITGLLVASSVSHVAAQQRYDSRAPRVTRDTPKKLNTDDSVWWWGLLGVLVLACAATTCLGGSGSTGGAGSRSTSGGGWIGEQPAQHHESRPAGDPPGVCYWGDTTMGTCVR
jgi:hypothetical protein